MENKVILESLQRLKLNNDYQYLCTQLKDIETTIDSYIFDEAVDHNEKLKYIIRRNSIRLFIDLPNDLIEQFKPQEEN